MKLVVFSTEQSLFITMYLVTKLFITILCIVNLMTLPQSIIISRKDNPKVAEFKKKIARRDNLKIIKKHEDGKKQAC